MNKYSIRVHVCTHAYIHLCQLFYFVENLVTRDGVSEGQFYQVLLYELDAIRKVDTLNFNTSLSLMKKKSLHWKKFRMILFLKIYTGLCLSRTKLPTACDIHRGSKTASH